jgi:hypothetical protein
MTLGETAARLVRRGRIDRGCVHSGTAGIADGSPWRRGELEWARLRTRAGQAVRGQSEGSSMTTIRAAQSVVSFPVRRSRVDDDRPDGVPTPQDTGWEPTPAPTPLPTPGGGQPESPAVCSRPDGGGNCWL